ncbi:uncharacterized protein HaLaN_10939 [Haematococcus lacustris]|uniref:Uncharacterized protein n=1 Tax=Haematococcus lacustris TaxID=44745 RepID=A0A699Z6C1_HAELA|nr:uncharacterized protein HaLaN_10939 [Haematococcus lacustris]
MPPKGRQKGAKRKRFVSNLAPFIYDPPAPDAVPPEYVKLRWPAVPTELSISLIKEAVHCRHRGTALDLTMWLNTVQPAASLQDVDDGCTLRELGVKGQAAGQPELLPLIQVFYDFTAPLCDDAIASVESCVLREAQDATDLIKHYMRHQTQAAQHHACRQLFDMPWPPG